MTIKFHGQPTEVLGCDPVLLRSWQIASSGYIRALQKNRLPGDARMQIAEPKHRLVNLLVEILALVLAQQWRNYLGGQKRKGQRDMAIGCDKFMPVLIKPKLHKYWLMVVKIA